MPPVLRPYHISDFESLVALWESTLGSSWPLTRQYLERMIMGTETYREGDHIVAEQEGHIVGFVATRVHASGKGGGIPLLIVSPEWQRQGVGTLLHDAAFEKLCQQQVDTINFTDGGDAFWPGVPVNVPGAVEFFKSCGFEERHFPFWTEFFAGVAEDGSYHDMVAAWEGDEVVGSLLINTAYLETLNPDAKWHLILGDDVGGIGAVGTNEAYERRGIGLAMVATGSEILKERGVRQCIIGWTDLLGFYGKLGYTIWREYAMAESRPNPQKVAR